MNRDVVLFRNAVSHTIFFIQRKKRLEAERRKKEIEEQLKKKMREEEARKEAERLHKVSLECIS